MRRPPTPRPTPIRWSRVERALLWLGGADLPRPGMWRRVRAARNRVVDLVLVIDWYARRGHRAGRIAWGHLGIRWQRIYVAIALLAVGGFGVFVLWPHRPSWLGRAR